MNTPAMRSCAVVRCSSCDAPVKKESLASCDNKSKTYICKKCMQSANSYYFLFARHMSQRRFVRVCTDRDFRSIGRNLMKYQSAGFETKIVHRPPNKNEKIKIGSNVPRNHIESFLPKPGESL